MSDFDRRQRQVVADQLLGCQKRIAELEAANETLRLKTLKLGAFRATMISMALEPRRHSREAATSR